MISVHCYCYTNAWLHDQCTLLLLYPCMTMLSVHCYCYTHAWPHAQCTLLLLYPCMTTWSVYIVTAIPMHDYMLSVHCYCYTHACLHAQCTLLTQPSKTNITVLKGALHCGIKVSHFIFDRIQSKAIRYNGLSVCRLSMVETNSRFSIELYYRPNSVLWRKFPEKYPLAY